MEGEFEEDRGERLRAGVGDALKPEVAEGFEGGIVGGSGEGVGGGE